MNGEKKASILVVDDNPANLDILVDYLKGTGFKIFVAPNGERALHQLEYVLPDIILLDVMMPGIDGFETCRRIKDDKRTKHIPVIFITALCETFDKVKGFYLGAVDYITKPFRREEVLVRIATHLTIQHQKRELSRLNAKLFESNMKFFELNAKYADAGTAKDKIFSILAHDMPHIVSSLIQASDVLTASFTEPKYEKLRILSDSVRYFAKDTYYLAQNLSEWSKFHIGNMKFSPRIIDFQESAEKNILIGEESAKRKWIYITNLVESGTFVYADPDMTDTILRNLISNAVKFTDNGGNIQISAVPGEDFTEICVSDTGSGISEENIEKLFCIEKTYRQNGTSGEKGAGLGLILCKVLVEKNRGEIRVKSRLGEGTEFYFTLPSRRDV
jgi:DNA-binding response OmpR family regulator